MSADPQSIIMLFSRGLAQRRLFGADHPKVRECQADLLQGKRDHRDHRGCGVEQVPAPMRRRGITSMQLAQRPHGHRQGEEDSDQPLGRTDVRLPQRPCIEEDPQQQAE